MNFYINIKRFKRNLIEEVLQMHCPALTALKINHKNKHYNAWSDSSSAVSAPSTVVCLIERDFFKKLRTFFISSEF